MKNIEEPDFSKDDVAECAKCGTTHDIESMSTKDSVDFFCAECQSNILEKKTREE